MSLHYANTNTIGIFIPSALRSLHVDYDDQFKMNMYRFGS